jgi:hypothetical protein
MALMRLPSSDTKPFACSPHAPKVSKAKGMKVCVVERAVYLLAFVASALAAAAPGVTAVART